MTTLALAAGGGGDALGILLLRDLLPELGEHPLIATFAWERLRIDPVPGPRSRDGFTNLSEVAGQPAEITSQTDTLPGGRSSLPRLAAETDARLFLLGMDGGAVGLSAQLLHLVEALDVDKLVVVDIGGDIIAAGTEAGIQSPLADAFALTAAAATGVSSTVVVAGPGLDGELSEDEVLARINLLGGRTLGKVEPLAAENLSDVLAWHPSEVSALLSAAALEIRGTVDLRRGGSPVHLTDTSSHAWSLALAPVVQGNLLVEPLAQTRSLAEANNIVRQISISEIDYEQAKAKNLSRAAPLTIKESNFLTQTIEYAQTSVSRGFDLITTRRLAESAGIPGTHTNDFVNRLSAIPDSRRGPLWNLLAIAAFQRNSLSNSPRSSRMDIERYLTP